MTSSKHIKIEEASKSSIVAALLKANGVAIEHTLRSYENIEQLTADAESRLIELIGPRTRGAGAQLTYTSGREVALGYGYERRATKVILERFASAWYLTSIKCVNVKPAGGGKPKLALTAEQSSAAVAYVQKKFSVLVPKKSEPPALDTPPIQKPDAASPAEPYITPMGPGPQAVPVEDDLEREAV